MSGYRLVCCEYVLFRVGCARYLGGRSRAVCVVIVLDELRGKRAQAGARRRRLLCAFTLVSRARRG